MPSRWTPQQWANIRSIPFGTRVEKPAGWYKRVPIEHIKYAMLHAGKGGMGAGFTFTYLMPEGLMDDFSKYAGKDILVGAITKASKRDYSDVNTFGILRTAVGWNSIIASVITSGRKDWGKATLDDVRTIFYNASDTAVKELKTAFYTNFRNTTAKNLSRVRLLRRNLLTELGSNTQIKEGDNFPYHSNIFYEAISQFGKIESGSFTDSGLAQIELGFSNIRDTRHPDYDGWRSSFKAPGEIALSIFGVQFNGGMMKSSNGKKMVIPTDFAGEIPMYGGTSAFRSGEVIGVKPSHGYVKNGIFYYFTTKSAKNSSYLKEKGLSESEAPEITKRSYNKISSGHPTAVAPSLNVPIGAIMVNFRDYLNTPARYVQNPAIAPYSDDKERSRPVFWTQDRSGKVYFTTAVEDALRKSHILGNVEIRGMGY